MFLDELDELLTPENLIATLPSWGEYFDISLKIWVESFGDGWSELLRFTATGDNCCKAGDRIPAIFLNSAGYMHLCSQVGSNGNFAKDAYINLLTWIKVEIKQYPKNGKVINFVNGFSNIYILSRQFLRY